MSFPSAWPVNLYELWRDRAPYCLLGLTRRVKVQSYWHGESKIGELPCATVQGLLPPLASERLCEQKGSDSRPSSALARYSQTKSCIALRLVG